jgi:hypothetical protein
MAPDNLSKIGFIGISIMIVLFIAISYAENNKVLWIFCVSVVFFFDLSYILISTKTQTENITVQNDTELSRINTEITNYETSLNDLRDQYKQAHTRETMDQLNDQINKTDQKIQTDKQQRDQRYSEVESGKIVKNPINTDKIFGAIPESFKDGRYLQAIVFAMICGIIQAMIVFSLHKTADQKKELEKVKEENEKPKIVRKQRSYQKKHIDLWVQLNWTNGNSHILTQQEFVNTKEALKIRFSRRWYDELKNIAIQQGLITKDLERLSDITKAKEVMK